MKPGRYVRRGADDGGSILPAIVPGAPEAHVGSAVCREVLYAIADNCDWQTWTTHVGRKTLELETRRDGRDISTAIRVLVAGGWLEVIGGGRGRGNTAEFRVLEYGAQNAGENAGENAGDHTALPAETLTISNRLSIDLQQQQQPPPDELKTRRERAPSSSSSSGSTWHPSSMLKRMARDIAAHKPGVTDVSGYAKGIEKNWGTRDPATPDEPSMAERVAAWHHGGFGRADVELWIRTDAPLEAARPREPATATASHPRDCVCGTTDGLIRVDADDGGHGTYTQCKIVQ